MIGPSIRYQVLPDLGISAEGYEELLRRSGLTQEELDQILTRHWEEGCCPSCIDDKVFDAEYGTTYGDLSPYCCCALMRMIDKAKERKGGKEYDSDSG